MSERSGYAATPPIFIIVSIDYERQSAEYPSGYVHTCFEEVKNVFLLFAFANRFFLGIDFQITSKSIYLLFIIRPA